MKTLKLKVDDLKVESFHTTPGDGKEADGTVFGFGPGTEKTCFVTCDTCENTCPATCATCTCATCEPTGLPGEECRCSAIFP